MVLTTDSTAQNPALWKNLKYSLIRVDKTGKSFQALFANGERLDAAYHEVGPREINFAPHYIALFAIKGHNTAAPVMHVLIRRFSVIKIPAAIKTNNASFGLILLLLFLLPILFKYFTVI